LRGVLVREAHVAKFSNPDFTASGEKRAAVSLAALKTLWFNTGTLCNIACKNCYIESSPLNDRLAYLTREEVRTFLAEAKTNHAELEEIGFTGGEPFMNPDILGMVEDSLAEGWKVLVLTNAMKPMQHAKSKLLDIHRRFPDRLSIRISIDHYTSKGHEEIRGLRTWQPVIEGLTWLAENGFDIAIASRNIRNETDKALRAGYQRLFETMGISNNAADPARLVIFPEMDRQANVPEITEQCWHILNKRPDSIMCASSRMVIKRKGAERPAVVSCTLLPYDLAFELGATLAEARGPVKLNHPHCAKFCVLGGASCSPRVK
jgi:organic radical activating enzyme